MSGGRYLLDTHVVLWLLLEPERVRPSVRDILKSSNHVVAASAVSGWEIAIKQSIGKLTLPDRAEDWLAPALERAGIDRLAIGWDDVLRVRALPWHHRDPFDRLLVAQAQGGWTLVTRDEALAAYGVPLLRAS
ncbi:MAG: type II toxin-antitoxin system VapC family toxin [Myxococcales bacterium]|nr:type II toxin-antitoxin system VapC family toxin [Myxococcales bacterium]